jgi:hypothetical protein
MRFHSVSSVPVRQQVACSATGRLTLSRVVPPPSFSLLSLCFVDQAVAWTVNRQNVCDFKVSFGEDGPVPSFFAITPWR